MCVTLRILPLLAAASCGGTLALPTSPSDLPEPTAFERCLLEGGELEITERIAAPVSVMALALHRDGSFASADPHGYTYLTRDGVDDILLPGIGDPSGGLVFSQDGRWLVTASGGSLALIEAETHDIRAWSSVSDVPLSTVAVSPDGGAIAWMDTEYSGHPTIMNVDPDADGRVELEAPEPVETLLWFGHSSAFDASGSHWLIAGHWYGVPMVEVRHAAEPEVKLASWMLSMDQEGAEPFGAIEALAPSRSGGPLLIAGQNGFDGGGFLGLLDVSDVGDPSLQPMSDQELPLIDYAAFTDHQAVDAHLLTGERVGVSLGAEGDLMAFSTDGLSPLTRFWAEEITAIAIDPDGTELIGGTAAGEVLTFGCAP